jgi:hypothetical protein
MSLGVSPFSQAASQKGVFSQFPTEMVSHRPLHELPKNSLVPIRCVHIDIDAILDGIPVEPTTFPIKYLSIPLSIWCLTRLDLQYLKDKATTQISSRAHLSCQVGPSFSIDLPFDTASSTPRHFDYLQENLEGVLTGWHQQDIRW